MRVPLSSPRFCSRAQKNPEFDFICLTPQTLESIHSELKKLDKTKSWVRGAWLIFASMEVVARTDKWALDKQKYQYAEAVGPARCLFYKKNAINAPHTDCKSGGRAVWCLVDDPEGEVAQLGFINYATAHKRFEKVVAMVPRLPFSIT